jgi:hypothetical protein
MFIFLKILAIFVSDFIAMKLTDYNGFYFWFYYFGRNTGTGK